MSTWTWSGERALLREYQGDLARANGAARAAYEAIRARAFDEVGDLVPGARTLLVELRPGFEPTGALLEALESEPEQQAGGADRLHELAVRYDGEDLAGVAALRGMSVDDIVALHSSSEYTVAFMGFSPGFAYLLGLPDRLATPRLETPRTRVPAGSVAIGGEYTGVYPAATPGGWRLIGRTDAVLFDPSRGDPALLHPGDRVRFVPG